MIGKLFKVTQDHLKLLSNMNVSWDSCEFGAPCIDPKRPYGNRDVVGDMCKILEVEPIETDDGPHYPKGTSDKMEKLHKEMETVLQIVLDTISSDILDGAYILYLNNTYVYLDDKWKPTPKMPDVLLQHE